MKEASLKDIDILDIDEVMVTLEKSLQIKYKEDELLNISNLGQLCDLSASKIINNSESCTSQEAFYKLRNAFSEILNIDKQLIEPNAQISNVLRNHKRRFNLKLIEKKIGMKLDLLQAPKWLTNIFILCVILGIISLFIKTFIGFIILIIGLLGLEFCKDYGNEIKYKTFKELTENLVLHNYSKARKLPNTANKNEIEKIVIGLFTTMLVFPKNKLTRESTF